MSEQEAQQCLFCKIIAGDTPGMRVYEDEDLIAILDINPAAKGHVLLMTKEHHFVLPLIPLELQEKLFRAARTIMTAMREALIVPRVTFFCANGPLAGQQSPHFLAHLIPREDDDGLEQLDLKERGVEQEGLEAIAQNMKKILGGGAMPAQKEQPAQAPTEQETSQTPKERLDTIFKLLEQEPQLHRLIMQDPDTVVENIKDNPTLNQVFEGVDVHALSQTLHAQAKKPDPQEDAVPQATTLSDDALKAFVESKPRLAQLLDEDIQGLERMIPQNERLKTFFAGTTPQAVKERLDSKGVDFEALKRSLG